MTKAALGKVARCVLEASAAAAVLFREPEAEIVAPRLFAMTSVLVPHIFHIELANVGRAKVLRREMRWVDAEAQLHETDGWPLEVIVVPWAVAWPLSQKHQLTVYDAVYLSLTANAPLLSLDGDLCRAAGKNVVL